MKVRTATLIPFLIIGAGILLRLWSFYDARSLFLDEANLALNIAELGIPDFFQPLRYQQYAPPLYLVAVKISTLVFGNNEWALRLPALLAGIFTLWLFYLLLKEWIQLPPARWIPLLLLACAPFLVRYSTELKQYSSDLLICLSLIYMAQKLPLPTLRIRHFIMWSFIGIFGIWASMPVVFILAGIGAYYGWQLFKRWDTSKALHFVWVGSSWLAAFFLLYHFVLQPSLQEEHLLNFHTPYFFPLNPLSAVSWQQAGEIMRGLLVEIVGYTALGLALGALLLVWGCIRLFKLKPAWFFLLIVPILATIIASSAGQFSLLPRVSLFLMPLFLLLISFGIEAMFFLIPGRWQLLPAALLLVGFSPIIKNLSSLGSSTEIEDIRAAILWSKEKESLVLVHHEAAPAYRYYSEYHDDRSRFQLNAILLTWDQTPANILSENAPARFVLLHSHLLSQFSRDYLHSWITQASQYAQLMEEYRAEGAAATLFMRR